MPHTLPELSHTPFRTLLLDDSDFDRRRIQRITDSLQLDIDFVAVDSIRAMTEVLDQRVFDLILLDLRLPEGDGFAALEIVRNHALNADAATVILTSDARSELAVAAVKGGCMDFISKDSMDPELLRRVVVSALHRGPMRDVTPQAPALDAEEIRQTVSMAVREEFANLRVRDEVQDALRAILRRLELGQSQEEADHVAMALTRYIEESEFDFRT